MDSVFNPTETAPAVKAGACVIQIGGNLADWVAMADWLTLAGRLAAKAPTVIVPTGGPFAETVREAEDMWRLSPAIVRRMMLLGMDSHALLLHGIRPDISRPLPTLPPFGRTRRLGGPASGCRAGWCGSGRIWSMTGT